VTQFTEVGWNYLKNGTGSGSLPQGGYYVTWVDPQSSDFTMNIVKISRDHASCTRPKLPDFSVTAETVKFKLAASMKSPDTLEVWHSNFETYDAEPPLFEHSSINVVDGSFTLNVKVGDMYTITTKKTGMKGDHGDRPKSSPSFPLPYSDDFESVSESQDAKLLADQIGAFEVHISNDGHKSLRQMVPELPIGWSDHGSNGPMTLIGMREWQDVAVSIMFKLPKMPGSTPENSACIASRIDQMWENGVVFCVSEAGEWNLTYAGPPLQGLKGVAPSPIISGRTKPVGTEQWHNISLTVQPPFESQQQSDLAEVALDGHTLFTGVKVRNLDAGFVGFGSNGWFPVEYRKLQILPAQRGWQPPENCPLAKVGTMLAARRCSRNGHVVEDQEWSLLPSFQLQHVASGLCATVGKEGSVSLQSCDSKKTMQLFVNDYTRIRNQVVPITVAGTNKVLTGLKTGEVSVGSRGDWNTWAYFPNSKQLRNQYVANEKLGYPMCLSTCHTAEESTMILYT